MANPNKFLDIEPIHQFRDDKDFEKKGDLDFIGSIQDHVIKKIKALRCADIDCRKVLLNDERSPMTGYCGHLFCRGCAEKLYGSPSSREYPKRIDGGNFEVDCPITPILYNCTSCGKDIKCHKKEKEHIVRVFSENIMFRDLFDALKGKPGFRCETCKADPKKVDAYFHPRFNSLQCVTCNGESDEDSYFCIWDAVEHVKDLSFHHLKILHNVVEGTDESQSLSSLDRTDRKVFAALYHCACCSTPLDNDVNFFKQQHCHLECGHFIGARCVENAREKLEKRMNEGLESLKRRIKRGDEDKGYEGSADQLPEGLYCNFCEKDPVKKSDLNVYPVFPPLKDILKGKVHTHYLLECKANCTVCEFTACKTLFAHPRLGEPPRDRCVWCEVEHRLIKKCNEKN